MGRPIRKIYRYYYVFNVEFICFLATLIPSICLLCLFQNKSLPVFIVAICLLIIAVVLLAFLIFELRKPRVMISLEEADLITFFAGKTITLPNSQITSAQYRLYTWRHGSSTSGDIDLSSPDKTYKIRGVKNAQNACLAILKRLETQKEDTNHFSKK